MRSFVMFGGTDIKKNGSRFERIENEEKLYIYSYISKWTRAAMVKNVSYMYCGIVCSFCLRLFCRCL